MSREKLSWEGRKWGGPGTGTVRLAGVGNVSLDLDAEYMSVFGL